MNQGYAERFPTFSTLRRHAREGRDFIIECRPAKSVFAIMAPHGGRIEPGTDIIADEIAGADHAYYAFKGMRRAGNARLHIPSTRFDEPQALELVRNAYTVLTVHGFRESNVLVCIGGLDTALGRLIDFSLQRSGFDVCRQSPVRMAGLRKENLCNRGLSGKGVQLEMSTGLRDSLVDEKNSRQMQDFVGAVRSALAEYQCD